MSIVLLYTANSTLKGKLSSQYRFLEIFFRHASFCHFLREWISKENLYKPWGSLWVFLCLVPCHVVRAKKSVDVSHSFALVYHRSELIEKAWENVLAFKTRLRAKPFLWKWVSSAWQKKIIFKSMAKHFTSLWNRGFGKPRNDLFVNDVRNRQSRLRCRNWIRSDAYTSFEI